LKSGIKLSIFTLICTKYTPIGRIRQIHFYHCIQTPTNLWIVSKKKIGPNSLIYKQNNFSHLIKKISEVTEFRISTEQNRRRNCYRTKTIEERSKNNKDWKTKNIFWRRFKLQRRPWKQTKNLLKLMLWYHVYKGKSSLTLKNYVFINIQVELYKFMRLCLLV